MESSYFVIQVYSTVLNESTHTVSQKPTIQSQLLYCRLQDWWSVWQSNLKPCKTSLEKNKLCSPVYSDSYYSSSDLWHYTEATESDDVCKQPMWYDILKYTKILKDTPKGASGEPSKGLIVILLTGRKKLQGHTQLVVERHSGKMLK